jgi:competence protein ComEA
VAALLPARPGGWLPPEDEAVGREGALQEAEPLVDERPDDPVGVARSWTGAGRHGSPLAGRVRLTPSRAGVVALVVVAALAAMVAAGLVVRGRPHEVAVPVVEEAGIPLPGAPSPSSAPSGEVVVAVAGKVRRPGLVRLPAGSRVDDAVRAAGGPLAGASTGLLNLARRLVDGEQVLVGVGPPPGSAAADGPSAAGGLLDLNAATVADLDALPGIGPVLAQRIVDWRSENTRFASVDQLREVNGIGEAKFGDLRAKVTV